MRSDRISPGAVLLLAAAASMIGAAAAWAQGEPGAVDEAAVERWGGWAMLATGMVFFAMWLMPAGPTEEEGDQAGWTTRVPMLQGLHRRIDRELTGWRRLQWPVLGLFFAGLGVASLMGWR